MDGNWHDFVSSQDAQGIAKWIGVIISAVLAGLGLERWYVARKQRKAEEEAKAKAELEARFAHKAELHEVEALHERIGRHKKANEMHVEGLHKTLDELKEANKTHKRIEEKLFDKIDENAKIATARHESVMNTLVQMNLNNRNNDKPGGNES